MEVKKNLSVELNLQFEDLRAIRGGNALASTSSFPCTVVEKDGSTRTRDVSSIEECLDFAGMN